VSWSVPTIEVRQGSELGASVGSRPRDTPRPSQPKRTRSGQPAEGSIVKTRLILVG
jgi:hypothetical protein